MRRGESRKSGNVPSVPDFPPLLKDGFRQASLLLDSYLALAKLPLLVR